MAKTANSSSDGGGQNFSQRDRGQVSVRISNPHRATAAYTLNGDEERQFVNQMRRAGAQALAGKVR